jgi:hypothetical protein
MFTAENGRHAMAAQEQTPLRTIELTASFFSNSASVPIEPADAALDRDDPPGHDDSLVERFLYNLRVALSAWHT